MNYLEKSSTTKAEIISAFKSVMSGYAAHSNEDMNETLAAMCPEFKATKSFQMSQSKSMYVVNYGLSPYFKSVLKTNIHKADFLVYSSYESLNHVTKCMCVVGTLLKIKYKLDITIPLSLNTEHILTC